MYFFSMYGSHSVKLHKGWIFVYSVTRKIAQYLGETLEDRSDKLQGNLQVNGGMFTSYHHQLKKGIYQIIWLYL